MIQREKALTLEVELSIEIERRETKSQLWMVEKIP